MGMTENEAKQILKDYRIVTGGFIDLREAIDMAIQALEEVQAYRATGLTPELIEAMQGHNIALINDLGEYQSIGTIEEFKALKEKNEPKKPIDKEIYLECPACGNLVTEDSYCQCGQYVK